MPGARLFASWHEACQRRRWLRGDKLEISTATAPKSIRGTWGGGRSRAAVMCYAKGQKKSSVAAEHQKLEGAKEAAKMKEYWARQLDALEKHLGK